MRIWWSGPWGGRECADKPLRRRALTKEYALEKGEEGDLVWNKLEAQRSLKKKIKLS